jgi:hypothetical protein
MLLADHPTTAAPNASDHSDTFRLQMRDSSGIERIFALGEGKHAIGSGPRCAVRITATGVQPLECVIVRNGNELRVRRWAPNTRLNGIDFDEAELKAGDLLQMGTAELHVVGPHFDPVVEPAFDTVMTPRPESESVELESPVDAALELAKVVDEERAAVDERSDPPNGNDVARTRNRKWFAAYRKYQAQYEELLDRVNSLESRLEAALSDRDFTPVDRAPNEPWHVYDEPTALDGGGEIATHESPEEIAADDWLISARAALSRDRSPWMESIRHAAEEPIEPTELDDFDAEINELRKQLAESEAQAVEAKSRMAALEQQLSENRRMLQHFADERSAWQTQLSDTEQRLAQYVERIQELAGQLETAREATAEVSTECRAPEAAEVNSTPVEMSAATIADDDWTVSKPQTDWMTNVSPTKADNETVSAAVATETVVEDQDSDDRFWQVDAEESLGDPTVDAASPTAPEESPQIMTEPAVEVAAEDVDSALAHLRELSIWRSEPVSGEELVAAESTPNELGGETTVDEARPAESSEGAVESKPQPPESYIDRYSHLFRDDEAAPAEPPVPTASLHPSPVPHQATTPPDEEEESVEQYMAKLLERMRGSGSGQSEENSKEMPTGSVTSANCSGDGSTSNNAESSTAPPAEPKPRMPAPVFAADMDALRALANQSARHAIGVHTSRTLRRTSLTRFVIAFLAGMTSLYLLLESPGWESLQFATACVAGLVTLYWGRLTYASVMKAIRVGAFDNVDENFVAIDGSKLPLPIDGKK